MKKILLFILLLLPLSASPSRDTNEQLFMPCCLETEDILGTWGLTITYVINNTILYDTIKWTILPGRFVSDSILCIKEIKSNILLPGLFDKLPSQKVCRIKYQDGIGTEELDYEFIKFRMPDYNVLMILVNGTWETYYRLRHQRGH